jgi:hypothetical protein
MAGREAPIRVVAAKDGYQEDALQLALAYVAVVLKSRPNPSPDIILLTHTKQQLSSTSLSSMLGQPAAKALVSGRTVNTPSGSLRHATLRTIGYSGRNSIIIAFYADEKMLDEVDSKPGIAAIIAVPHQDGEVAKWAERWDATIHGEPKRPRGPLITDPVVASAMKTLTTLSNTSYGSMHPRDVEHAKEIFRILRNKGHDLVPEEVKSWAIREGWHPGAATEAAKIAKKIKELKTKPSISGFHDPVARYERWKKGE